LPTPTRNESTPSVQVDTDKFNPCPSCATQPAAGRTQGIAFEHGRGRIVVIGEMGTLVDYSVASTDNRQFTLNIVRWLVREL
jgi:hypothetical protein